MAERTEILSIKLDADGALKELTDIGMQLRKVAAEKEKIQDLYKSGAIEERDYVKRLIENKTQTQALTQQQAGYQRSLTANQKLIEKNNGSLEDMRTELSGLTAAYSKLTKEERENAEIGGKHLTRMKQLSDELKEAEKAYGQTARNVGNYSDAIKEAMGGIQIFGVNISELGDNLKGKVSQGLGIAKQGFGSLRGAIMSTGIGALLIAITSLVSYFTKTREGSEKVQQAMAFLGGAIELLTRKSAEFGKALWEAITTPMAQIQKVGNFLKLAFTDPGKALEQLKANVKGLQINLGDLAKEAVAAGKEIAEITRLNQILERDRIANLATSKELIRDQEAMKNIRDNEFNDINKRIGANEKAAVLERERLARLAELAQRSIDLLERDARRLGGIEKLSNDQYRTLMEARLELADLQEESIGRENELITNRYQLEQERLAQLAVETKAAADLRVLQAIKGTEEELAARRNALAVERNEALRSVKSGSLAAAFIREDFRQKDLQLQKDYLQQLLDAEQKRIDDFKALTDKEYADQIKATEEYYQKKQLEIAEEFANGVINLHQYNTLLEGIEAESLNRRIQDAKDYNKDTTALELEAANKRVEIKRNEVEAKMRLEQEAYSFASESVNAVAQLNSVLAGEGRGASEFARQLALVQIGIDAARSISQIITLATAPSVDNIATGGLGVPIKIAALSATVLANIAQARNLLKEVPSYHFGGVLEGPSHKDGGIQVYNRSGRHIAEVEGGEPILTAKVSKNPDLLRMASAINVAAGGRPLITSNFNAQGGLLPSTTRSYLAGNSQGVDYNKLAHIINSMPAPQVTVKEIATATRKVQVKERVVNS